MQEKTGTGVPSGAAAGIFRPLIVRLGLSPVAVAYAMTTVGAAMINNIFGFYYVKLFLNNYKISEGAFQRSQVLYMVWNAVNDPLFGYLQDTSKARCCSSRRHSILFGAPFYSLAFLLAWFPWRSYGPSDWLCGVHLIVALSAFDGMLTFVLLAQSALFAEISTHHQMRIKLIKYSQVASVCGSSSILFCGLLTNNMEDFATFQIFTVFVAVVSCCCMLYTGVYAESRYDNKEAEHVEAAGCEHKTSVLSLSTLPKLMCQILTNRDFLIFVLMNFFQVFLLTFFHNFTIILTEHLIPPDVLPSAVKSIMYGAGFICPQLVVLSCQRLLHGLGYYRMMLTAFYIEAGLAAIMLILGPQHYYFLAFYLTFNMIIMHAASSLFSLPLADIIDKDMQKYKRSSPISSMVFGTNALFTKPSQSLAPMLVLNILNQFGYERLKDKGALSDPSDLENLRNVMFYLVCLVPMIVACVQVVAWRPFSIRNSHSVEPKYIDG